MEVLIVDFRRSTIVLIISFLLLNIFLLFTYKDLKQQIAPAANGNINIIDQMRSDGISVVGLTNDKEEAAVVQITPSDIETQVETLVNQKAEYEKGTITSILTQSIPIEITNAVNQDSFKQVTDFIHESVINGKQYELFSFQLTNKVVIYQQMVGTIPIVDKKAQIIVNLNDKNEAVSYEQTYVGKTEILGEPRQLISSQVAVETLYLAGSIPARTMIEKPKLVYYETLALSDLSIYSPAWYIELRVGEGATITKKVDAIRGNIISSEAE